MDVVLALTLLCAGAPGALSALPVVDMSAPPEASSASALMSAFVGPHKACVVVLGRARWTNAFLHGVPQETPRVVLTEQSLYEESDSLALQVRVRHHVLVVVADGPEALTLSTVTMTQSLARFHRALFWTTVATSVLEVVANKTFLGCVTQWRSCNAQTVLALTAADGTTALYALVPDGCPAPAEGEVPSATELDRWAPEERRWLSGASPFSKFCDSWLPPAPDEPFTLYVLGWGGAREHFDRLSDDLKRYNSLDMRITKTIVSLYDDRLQEVVARMKQCRLDGFVVRLNLQPLSSDEMTCFFDATPDPIVVIVPAGLGPAVNPLDAVLVEFSPAVWLGTALAALSTAAALACTLRRDRGAALLLALTPLLAQAPERPPPASRALRPLLGVWLLVCVVLVAAYQGLLLGNLSTARAYSEIDSLRDLEDSGLPVHVSWPFVGLLPENVRRRIVARRSMENPTDFIANRVVSARDCAIIVGLDEELAREIRVWLTPKKLLHFFTLGDLHVRINGVWSRGSALGKTIALAFRRYHEMALSQRYSALADFKERLSREKSMSALSPAQPLTLRQMYPAFLCIIGGHILSVVVFVVELLVSRLTDP
ncbi:Ionotropic receptor 147 [Frankliniella occidentalis]|nr:Ionotropic receptor 147 [Frankliniella occidentalis]